MTGIGIQERYDDISNISGLSEDIIRRVLKASRQSLVKSLKNGERATLPGICTITPELKSKIDYNKHTIVNYIKLKAKASPALDTELEKSDKFSSDEKTDEALIKEEEGLSRLNFINGSASFESTRYNPNSNGVITKQISALL